MVDQTKEAATILPCPHKTKWDAEHIYLFCIRCKQLLNTVGRHRFEVSEGCSLRILEGGLAEPEEAQDV